MRPEPSPWSNPHEIFNAKPGSTPSTAVFSVRDPTAVSAAATTTAALNLKPDKRHVGWDSEQVRPRCCFQPKFRGHPAKPAKYKF